MFPALLAVTTSSGFRIGLVATAVGLGFRHGIDWDHIAALTDITGTQEHPRRSMFLATLYALGHALVVLTLGILAIVLSAKIPEWLDGAMEYFVGLTLLVLGAYVLISLTRQGRDFRMRSRWMLIFAGVRHVARWTRGDTGAVMVITHEHDHPVDEPHDPEHAQAHALGHDHVHEPVPAGTTSDRAASQVAVKVRHHHVHRHVGTLPEDPLPTYGRATAFSIGALHGIGAETPTQVLLFLAAARAGGAAAGILLLVCFLVGLVASNTVVALTATFGFLKASHNFAVYAATSLVVALFSLVVGTMFVLGQGSSLGALLGG